MGSPFRLSSKLKQCGHCETAGTSATQTTGRIRMQKSMPMQNTQCNGNWRALFACDRLLRATLGRCAVPSEYAHLGERSFSPRSVKTSFGKRHFRYLFIHSFIYLYSYLYVSETCQSIIIVVLVVELAEIFSLFAHFAQSQLWPGGSVMAVPRETQ